MNQFEKYIKYIVREWTTKHGRFYVCRHVIWSCKSVYVQIVEFSIIYFRYCVNNQKI